jgi:hypothetical protein
MIQGIILCAQHLYVCAMNVKSESLQLRREPAYIRTASAGPAIGNTIINSVPTPSSLVTLMEP